MLLSGSEKMIEELLRLVDDGTLTDDERSLVTQAIQSGGLAEETDAGLHDNLHASLIEQLRSAMVATRLPGENQATDKTLVKNIVEQLLHHRKLETHDEATSQTSDQALSGIDSAEDASDLTGQSIGSYRILQLIGRGGMGAVYEATDQLLHRHVALKVMLPSVAVRAQNRARFLREAQAVARVEHDHICPIYQVGEDRGHAFIAMPLLLGETLESRLRQGRLAYPQIVDILIQIAQGLDAAHQAGLIHRDIKPANVWIEKRKDGQERVRLLDFGLAQMDTEEPSLTQPGSIMGTPLYMAPEQARGEPVDARTDLFSIGAIMYELLTGKRAFSGKTPTSVLSSILVDTPATPASIEAACPQCLSDLAMQLLEKDPVKRVPGAAALQATLVQCRAMLDQAQVRNVHRDERQSTAVTLAETMQFEDVMHASGPSPRIGSASPAAVVPLTASPLTAHRNSAPLTQSAGSRQIPWFGRLVALGILMLGLIACAAAGVLLFQTPTGTLVVEASEDAKILFEKGELQLLNESGAVAYRISAREPVEKIKSGKYQVQVVGADGLSLSTEAFEIHRNEKTVIRISAMANRAGAKSEDERAGALAEQASFPGKVVFATDFKDPKEWPIALVDSPNTESQIKNDTLIYRQLRHDEANPFLTIPLVAQLSRGACAIRCKTDEGNVYFNFCVRNSGTRSRAISFSIKDGSWNVFVQRQDYEENRWKIVAPIRLASSTVIRPGLGKDQWMDIAFHWSEKNYDIWIDGEHIAGGTLPTDELANGLPQPPQIGMRTSPTLLPRIEIDFIGLWDQTDVPIEDARRYSMGSSTRPVRN